MLFIVFAGLFPTKDIQKPLPPQFLWKMCNVLKRMKIKFLDFYFSIYRENSSEIDSFYNKNDHNSKNKNRIFDFSLYSADSGYFM